jgi:hypothetical protein
MPARAINLPAREAIPAAFLGPTTHPRKVVTTVLSGVAALVPFAMRTKRGNRKAPCPGRCGFAFGTSNTARAPCFSM